MIYRCPNSPAHSIHLKIIGTFFVVLLLATGVTAQTEHSKVRISVQAGAKVSIEIDLDKPTDSWSFINSYAGALGLGERVSEIRAQRSGIELPVRKIASGEFRVEGLAEHLTYVVTILPLRPGDFAHVSWLTSDHGLLLLSDLLPEALLKQSGVSIKFDLPAGWRVGSVSDASNNESYRIDDLEKAAFLVAADLRVVSKLVRDMPLKLVIDGRWNVEDEEVLQAAGKVLDYYFELTRFKLFRPSAVLVSPLPPSASTALWKAETRGSTVVLLMNPQAQIKNWSGQLGVIFTHEIFHFWVPNALALSGDYDWFFEGFTLYTALQAALDLKLITFKEFLDTLSRVYDSYLSYSDDQTLLEASERRWTSSTPIIYDKGMLVAFLYDLTLRNESGGESTLAACYPSVLRVGVGKPADANDVIIGLLGSSAATRNFSQTYIESRSRVELEKILPSFGLEVNSQGNRSQLKLSKELTANQRKLWRSIGYRS